MRKGYISEMSCDCQVTKQHCTPYDDAPKIRWSLIITRVTEMDVQKVFVGERERETESYRSAIFWRVSESATSEVVQFYVSIV